jgi:hypothetical protein
MQDHDVQPSELARRRAGWNGDRRPGADVLAGIGAKSGRSPRAARGFYLCGLLLQHACPLNDAREVRDRLFVDD